VTQPQRKLSELFDEPPAQWNLRGDPHLWREMKETIDNYEVPDTEEQFSALIARIFQQLTRTSLAEHEPVFIEKYSHGGMSSGYISPQFWAEQMLPFLLRRYRESK
jgi:hypothetical protein